MRSHAVLVFMFSQFGCNVITGIGSYETRSSESSPPESSPLLDADALAEVAEVEASGDSLVVDSGALETGSSETGDTCPVHKNGLGQVFSSCLPMGKDLAIQARAAWPGKAWSGPAFEAAGAMCAGSGAFRQGPDGCAIWMYEGSLAGKVRLTPPESPAVCECPSVSDKDWG